MLWRSPSNVPPIVTWGLFAASLGYAFAVPIALARNVSIRRLGFATSLGDAPVIIGLSAISGGIHSDVYWFAYTAVLAAAIRYGIFETFLSVLSYGMLTALLYVLVPDPGATFYDLGIRLFFILFLAAMAGALSAEVKRHSRQAVAERDRSQFLLRRLIGAEEEERKRLAGEIHDRLGRRFFEFYHGIGREADALRANGASASGLDRLGADARACADEIRNLANELRPSILDDFGFVEAMRESVAALEAQGGMVVRLNVDVSDRLSHAEVNVMLFRVLQEAILNVRKHSRASKVTVELLDDDSGGVRLALRDDGRGFDPSSAPPRGHLGLLTMRERVEACGATLTIRSRPGWGSEVEVIVPREALSH